MEAPSSESGPGLPGTEVVDPASSTAVPVARVEAAGPSRGRWALGGGVAIGAIFVAAWAASVLSARPLPEALRYVPGDAVVVAEVRPELPGDQRQHLGNFLAHFPGFADQSTLDQKLDESLDRLLKSSGQSLDYARQVKPLLAGPMELALTPADLRALAPGGVAAGGGTIRLLAVITTDGTTTCDQALATATTDAGSHRGVAVRQSAVGLACALDGRFLLAGSPADVSAAIDAHLDGTGIDTSGRFRTARGRLQDDQLASVYVDGTAALGIAREALAAAAPGGVAGLPATIADWMIAGLRVVDDALVVDVETPTVASAGASGEPTAPPPAAMAFAAMLPSDTFGFAEVHGAGALVDRALARLRTDATAGPVIDRLDSILGPFGGSSVLTGWIRDAAVAAVPVGDSASAVLLVRGPDPATTTTRFVTLRGLVELAGPAAGIVLGSHDHGGITITDLSIADPAVLFGGAGGGATPGGSGGSAPAPVRVSAAVLGDVLVVGLGDGAVERVIDTAAGSALATTGTYGRALSLVDATNRAGGFIALDTILGWVEGHLLRADARASFDTDSKPYTDHLAGVAASTTVTGDGLRSRIVLTIK